MGDLTANFSQHEFACKCGCGYGTILDDIDWALVDGLQEMRDRIGAPIQVNSGCRCEHHNKAVGGGMGSQHLYGRAADIQGPGQRVLYEAALKIPQFENGGIGYDKYLGTARIHVDVRGHRARW